MESCRLFLPVLLNAIVILILVVRSIKQTREIDELEKKVNIVSTKMFDFKLFHSLYLDEIDEIVTERKIEKMIKINAKEKEEIKIHN